MIDAMQVFVRGFETQERGNVVMEYLTELGFQIAECFDGQSDSLGGLIETHVASDGALEPISPDIILTNLRQRTGFNGLWVQARKFTLTDEGEYGREEEEEESHPSRVIDAE